MTPLRRGAGVSGQRLTQWQCQKDGSLFYYQHTHAAQYLVRVCPLCGSKRILPTGRTYDPVDEDKPATNQQQAAKAGR